MIGTLEGSLVPRPETDARASMPARVDESSKLAVTVPHENYRHPPVHTSHEVTRIDQLLGAREVLPGGGEKLSLLDGCDSWIAVPGPGNRLSGQLRGEISTGGHGFPVSIP